MVENGILFSCHLGSKNDTCPEKHCQSILIDGRKAKNV
jgi:hypothetical protein